MRARKDALLRRGIGDQVAERRIAWIFVGQILDEVRQLVAGIDALEQRIAVDVVTGVDQPVHIEHDHGIHIQFAAAAADDAMTFDRCLAAAVMLAGHLRQVHRRHMRDLGSERERCP